MYTIIQTTMRPGSTIEGLIRFYNHLDVDKEQLQKLVDVFNDLNSEAKPPKPFQKVLMPVLTEFQKITTYKYRTGD